MFEENIDEQLIKSVTGHRSNAVRDYKRPNDNLRKKVSCIVQGQKSSADNKAGFNTETKNCTPNMSITVNVNLS